MKEKLEPFTFYCLTEKTGKIGASMFLNKGIVKELSENSALNFYILPSSIHETILMPVPTRCTEYDSKLLNMICNSNHNGFLSDKEILDDAIYYYDRETDSFSLITA